VQGVHKSETMNVKTGRYDFMRFALRLNLITVSIIHTEIYKKVVA
jgi:hypothetical protein